MLDLPGFWSGWVIALTLIGLAWLAWLLATVYFSKRARQDEAAESQLVWDENLREGTAPPPLWWFWLLVALLVFSLVYLILYPGLGSLQGALQWTQAGQLQQSQAADQQQHGARRAGWLAADLPTLAADPTAMAVARRLYANHCASCHGVDARGQAKQFPDLTDAAWQWGSSEAQLLHTLREGRISAMPPWGELLGEAGAHAMANYVLALGTGTADRPEHAASKAQFSQFCVICHAANGQGVPALGGSDLTDNAWTYGGELPDLIASITQGRTGVMPPQKRRLTEPQIRLLAAWLQAGAPGL